jgi:type IV pilus assembly protein PilF
MNKAMARYISPALTAVTLSLLSGCVTQSFENNEPIVKTQANRDEMAATRVSLGLGYLKMGDMSQAKLNLEKAKRFSPNLVQVHTAFAHFYETVGENNLAIESFEQALSIKADSADTLNNYGVFLCRQNKVEAAEKQFLKAIAVPSYLLVAQSYENLASCYLESDNFDKAEMYLNKAIFHSPNRTQTLLQMVRLQYAMGNYKESKRFLQKFERNTQRFTADSLALAYKLFWKLGQRRTAGNYANMLVKMYPQSWEAKQYLLNELDFIEADNLARKYQLSKREQGKLLAENSKKRVVKLSPNKANNLPKAKTVTPTVAKQEKSIAETTDKIANTKPLTKEVAVTSPAVQASSSVVATSKDVSKVLSASVLTSAAATPSAENIAAEVALENIPLSTEDNIAMVVADDVKKTNSIDTTVAEVKPVESETALLTQSPQVVSPDANSSIEPTSTAPVPAQRDEPLPKALSAEIVEDVDPEAKVTQEIAPKDIPDEKLADQAVIAVSKETEQTSEVTISSVQAMHKVKSGENLYNISVKYNVKLKALRKWNDIDKSNKIRTGDKLYVVDPQTVKND